VDALSPHTQAALGPADLRCHADRHRLVDCLKDADRAGELASTDGSGTADVGEIGWTHRATGLEARLFCGEVSVTRHEVVPRNPDTRFCHGSSRLGFGADRTNPSSPSVSGSAPTALSAIQAIPATGVNKGLFHSHTWAWGASEPAGHTRYGCAFPEARRTRLRVDPRV
jgi:hypothetical protein